MTETSRRLRLGVIGAGAWAIAAHLPAFARRIDVEPLIVSRRGPADWHARHLGIEAVVV